MNLYEFAAIVTVAGVVGGCFTEWLKRRHVHKWEIIERCSVYDIERPKDSLPHHTSYTLQCTECGNLKTRKGA